MVTYTNIYLTQYMHFIVRIFGDSTRKLDFQF